MFKMFNKRKKEEEARQAKREEEARYAKREEEARQAKWEEEARYAKWDEILPDLIAEYKAANTDDERDAVVEKFAEKSGFRDRSVRAKLVHEGVYIEKVARSEPIEEARSESPTTAAEGQKLAINLIKDYKILTATTAAELADNVKSSLKDGWMPRGGVCAAAFGIDNNKYAQAMVKYG